jgi:ketosteroid isomerase-like protein
LGRFARRSDKSEVRRVKVVGGFLFRQRDIGMAGYTKDEADVLAVNQKLLDAIAEGDWATYAEVCDESLTAFEPEALGHLVAGLPFHEFYFKLPGGGGGKKPVNSMLDPHIRVVGDVAVLCYYRLKQGLGADGGPVSVGTEETRVWQKKGGVWKHVHFHRSPSQKG